MTNNHEVKNNSGSKIGSYGTMAALIGFGYLIGFKAGVTKVTKNNQIVANTYSDLIDGLYRR